MLPGQRWLWKSADFAASLSYVIEIISLDPLKAKIVQIINDDGGRNWLVLNFEVEPIPGYNWDGEWTLLLGQDKP